MSTEQSAASRTEVGPVETAAVGPDQTAVPTYIRNKTLSELLYRRAIHHLRTRPYTPRTNGKVERYQQTLQREWAYALQYASSDARRASLPHWVRHYNEQRTHSALNNRPPIHRVRDVTGHNT